MPGRGTSSSSLPLDRAEPRPNAGAPRMLLAKPVGSDASGASRAARLDALERENAQLRGALASRIAIEQAKGVLAERFRLDLDEAFELLRGAARSNRISIHALAAAVTPLERTPPEVEDVVLRHIRASDSGRPRNRLQEVRR